MLLDPPRVVAGFPIEILEITASKGSFLWDVRVRVRTGERIREAHVILAADRRVIFAKMPSGCPDSFRTLVAARGSCVHRSPLADAIEEAARPPPPS